VRIEKWIKLIKQVLCTLAPLGKYVMGVERVILGGTSKCTPEREPTRNVYSVHRGGKGVWKISMGFRGVSDPMGNSPGVSSPGTLNKGYSPKLGGEKKRKKIRDRKKKFYPKS